MREELVRRSSRVVEGGSEKDESSSACGQLAYVRDPGDCLFCCTVYETLFGPKCLV